MKGYAGRYPNKIPEAIAAAETTRSALARAIDMDPAEITRLCQGRFLPSVVLAIAVARALNTTVEALWGALRFRDCRQR